jgi:hypothetical protein
MPENKEGSSIFICWSGKRSKDLADAVDERGNQWKTADVLVAIAADYT